MGKKKTHEDFMKELEEKGLLEKINVLGHYVNNRTPIKIQCKTHLDCIWSPVPYALLKSTGQCKKCLQEKYSNLYKLTELEVKQRLIDNKIPFELVGEYKGNDVVTQFKCLDCGEIYNCAPMWIFTGRAHCQYCYDKISFPNKLIRNLLVLLEVDNFKYEFKDSWTKNYRYDAYFTLNNEKWLVEMDGELHFKQRGNKAKAKKDFEKRKKADKDKDKLAKENGYNLIRINCDFDSHIEIIEQIKQSRLSELFDLENFDWDKCLKLAERNLVKEVCEYFDSHDNMNSTKLSKIFLLDSSTVAKYLKIGTNYGWCDYNPKEIMCRKIKVWKVSGEYIGEFEKIRDFQKYALDNFGIKIWNGTVSACCSEKTENVKGFVFEYIK